MSTLASWNAQPIATSDTQKLSASWRWKPAYLTRIFLVLAWAMSFTVVLRAASIWSLLATDTTEEFRSHVQEEIAHWISQRPATSAKTYVVACGSIERGIIPQESSVEAMIDDPSKPGDAGIFACRFTLDSSGSIIDAVERSVPIEVSP
jgi:hypothetical protein